MCRFRKRAWRWEKRAWRWRKRAWRDAIVKVARGNTMISAWLSELARPIKNPNTVEFVEEFRLKLDLMNIQ